MIDSDCDELDYAERYLHIFSDPNAVKCPACKGDILYEDEHSFYFCPNCESTWIRSDGSTTLERSYTCQLCSKKLFNEVEILYSCCLDCDL